MRGSSSPWRGGGHGEASTSDRSHSNQNDWADVHGRHFYLGNLGDLQGAGNGSGSCLPTGTKVELSMYATSLVCLFPGEECPLILQRYVDGRRETARRIHNTLVFRRAREGCDPKGKVRRAGVEPSTSNALSLSLSSTKVCREDARAQGVRRTTALHASLWNCLLLFRFACLWRSGLHSRARPGRRLKGLLPCQQHRGRSRGRYGRCGRA